MVCTAGTQSLIEKAEDISSTFVSDHYRSQKFDIFVPREPNVIKSSQVQYSFDLKEWDAVAWSLLGVG